MHTVGKPVRLARARSLFADAFTEAPNGVVYFAAGKTVYVVSGAVAKAVLTTAKPVLALAVNAGDIFVQSGLTVTEYTRSHAAMVRDWTLYSPVKAITSAGLYAVGGTVWSWTDWATDLTGFELATVSRISTSSRAVKVISKSNVYPGDMAADATGAYFETVRPSQANGFLVHATAGGGTNHVIDVNVDAPLTLAGGRVEILSLHSNGLSYVDSYRAVTLAAEGSRRVPADARNIAGTSAGLLIVQEPCTGLTCAKASIGVLSPATGAVSHAVRVPGATELLFGPAPAVITDTGGWLYLVRLAR